MDWIKGPLGHLPHGKKFPKGHPFLLSGAFHQITQEHGLKGNPFPQGTDVVRWSVLLSVMWGRRTEQSHGGEPPMH